MIGGAVGLETLTRLAGASLSNIQDQESLVGQGTLVGQRVLGRGLKLAGINPRPDTVFRHLRSDRGGYDPPLGVSKRSVIELSGKDQQIALAEYSRLVVLFLVLGQYLTQLWQVKGQNFGNSMVFQFYASISAKLSIVAAWDLHQRVPRSILHRIRCFDASRLNI